MFEKEDNMWKFDFLIVHIEKKKIIWSICSPIMCEINNQKLFFTFLKLASGVVHDGVLVAGSSRAEECSALLRWMEG